MNSIGIITNEDFDLKSVYFSSPRVRYGARGIIKNIDGKIAIFNKQSKNEYKLPGGGVDIPESIEDAFKREAMEETGCKVEIEKLIGIIEEHRSTDNFIQISYVFEANVIENTGKLNLTEKEEDEDARVIWVEKNEALKLVSNALENLIPDEYENIYHSKFMILRDKKILEYYLK